MPATDDLTRLIGVFVAATAEARPPDELHLMAIADAAEEAGDDPLAAGCRLCAMKGWRPWPVNRSPTHYLWSSRDGRNDGLCYPSMLPPQIYQRLPGGRRRQYPTWADAVRALASAWEAAR
jgi:hypothetical protein